MPIYSYKAKSFSGETKEGEMAVRDEHQLAKVLHEQGYVLITATLKKGGKRKGLNFDFFSFRRGVSLKEKLMFTRNLRVMIASGISLPQALRTLSLQMRSRRFQKVLLAIGEEIKKGKTFSECLKNYPYIFSPLFYQMIKVGEESGTMEESLENLALQMERTADLKSKVKSALIYPSVIISVMIIIAILMLIIVVPKLADVFKDLNMKLPFTTQVIINLGTFLEKNFLLVVVVFFFFLFFLYSLSKTREGKRIKDGFLLKMPIIAPLIKKINASYMVRNLSVLTASGVSFLRSLEIIADVLPNVFFKEAILKSREQVQKGGKLSEALREYKDLFPPAVIQMLQVGEETGETAKILGELADFFEQEVTVATKNLVSLIEPLLMVLIGAMVGFFAISMIQPIYSMLGGL